MDFSGRMQYLVKTLNEASDAYYGGKPEILSDHEWDALFDELTRLEKESGVILMDSPTHKVSSAAPSGKQIVHEFPALSLPKSKSVADVRKWIGDKPFNISWKLDGLTLVATYDNGIISQLALRGGGIEGDDVTHLIPAIRGVLPRIDYKGHLVLRGECVTSYSALADYNREMGTDYESPRNFTSGSCNATSTLEKVLGRPLDWKVFTLVYMDDEAALGLKSQVKQFEYLRGLGFDTVDIQSYFSIDDLDAAIAMWSDKVESFDYPVDGLVITYDDVDYSRSGSLTEHHSTTGGFAFKWADEEYPTELVAIEWSPSVISWNPVGIFEEVNIDHTSVKRASLCNISECERLGIGGKGTKIKVIKANKIIPKVVSAIKSGEFIIPDKCPACGKPTEIRISESGTKILVCPDKLCPAKHISKLTRFVSKYGFDIRGLSERKLLDLLTAGLVSNYDDILSLPDNKDKVYESLSDVEGWGEKSIENLLNEIFKARKVKFANVLYALCIPMCGRDASKQIANNFSPNDLLSLDDKVSVSHILGAVKGNSVYEYFADESNKELFDRLIALCDIELNSSVNNGALSGMTVVITGKLNHFKNRDELQAIIENLGGKVAGSVSGSTTYLINNDVTSTSGKNKKALSLGVAIISEDDFLQQFSIEG